MEVVHTRLDLVALWSQAIQPDRGLSSEDAVGNEADRLEFRQGLQQQDRHQVLPNLCSGPTLVQTIKSVRENRARVEGPEQTQFAQLAAVHEGWWNSSIARDEAWIFGSLCGRAR